ncbi:nuclear condensing complex subunit [Suillus tomentosus]|nr:nuclear condensing complex subunit [Suillus tomentosus]
MALDSFNYSNSYGDGRRAALLNIPLSSATLDAVLGRTRDIDTIMRKLVYFAILIQHCFASDGSAMGLIHPRVLTISQREIIIRNGLDVKNKESQTVEDNVLALLSLSDLTESTVAEDALLSVLDRRADISDHVEFNDAFLPVVTALAYRIQAAYNAYQEDLEVAEQERVIRGEPTEEEEEARIDKEFVIGEMFKVAVNLDYADEIGRQKMFQLMRDMISQEVLPESLVARCLDVLRILSPNERDLIQVVVEVVHELRDVSDEEEALKEPADDGETNFGEIPMPTHTAPKGPKPSEDMSSEERARMDAIDLRCLSLCIGMLERVNGTFEENSTLEGILGELIITAVKRKELVFAVLLLEYAHVAHHVLFLGRIQTAQEVLRIRMLQIVFDILMVHENDFLEQEGSTVDNNSFNLISMLTLLQRERIIEFFLQVLETEKSDKVQGDLCIGLSKLVLSGMIPEDKVLQSLVGAHLAPDTIDNQEVRQCLAYFFPVYCYSSAVNQRRMQPLFIGLFEQLAPETRNVDETQDMVSPAQIAAMFVDWTDPQKAM